jgi:uncharacterized protein YyaL (SSP411 family)
MNKPKFTNHLINETSPYLLQHAHNPVDWFGWNDEAFEKAKAEDKPVLVSIGYSACHWCHVMEHESFEDEATARMMNEKFVNIKVDLEERPDVDQIYMTFVQMTSGHGGYPLNVFLTPDKKPFFGGTYFPPVNRYNMPSFQRILASVSEAYHERKDEVVHSANEILGEIQKMSSVETTAENLSLDLLDFSYRSFVKTSIRSTEVSAARQSFRHRCLWNFYSGIFTGRKIKRRLKWSKKPAVKWRMAEFTTSSAAVFIATRLTRFGSCRISRKCFTTMRSLPEFICICFK